MSDDLTKLSGPELANALEWSSDKPRSDELAHEAARRLREDTREWQRNLERERDGLRTELADVKAELHKWRNGHQLQAFQEDLNEMLGRATDAERERDGLRERAEFAERELSDAFGLPATIGPKAGEAKRVVDGLRASCANQRKELHSLNVERKATLTKLEDAQRRVAELEAQRELDAGSLRSAINNAQSRLAQVKRLEAQLREAQNAGADEWTADGEAVPEPAERKAQVERMYGAGCGPGYDGETLDEILADPSAWSHVTYQLAEHLRETLATIDAVRALAEKLDVNGMRHSYSIASELREVLDGKR